MSEAQRVVGWFSCGVTSAVAIHRAINKYPNLIPAYCDTGSEHPDNSRFLADCEKWYERPIMILRSDKYSNTWEVFESGYLVGPKGAKCTTELKKKVREKFQREDDVQVFGFDIDERSRALRFNDNNPETETYFPLIEDGISKEECFGIIRDAKIEVPKMYRLGFKNNNCIGCVKGGAGYWNKIRDVFPETFSRMAGIERKLGASILSDRSGGTRKRLFLDQLKPGIGRYEEMDINCGLFCGEL